ncbi:MAG TPA: hypothetical protein VEZ46_02955 [Mycobacteriales bacterium]|nr:hypothetical protein [Mycobacteriales bacterium]
MTTIPRTTNPVTDSHKEHSMRTSSDVFCYQVAGRAPGSGPVVAVLTDGPADLAAAAAAAGWSADTGTRVVAAAVVVDTGFSIDPLLHRARARRMADESAAITGRVAPTLAAAGVEWRPAATTVKVATDVTRALPVAAVHRLVDRFTAAAVVTSAALDDPTGRLRLAARDAAAAGAGTAVRR